MSNRPFDGLCFIVSETGSHCKVLSRDIFQFTFYNNCSEYFVEKRFWWVDMKAGKPVGKLLK